MTEASTADDKTYTEFNLTVAMTPAIPDSELTYSIMDGMIDTYVPGLQEYLATLGVDTDVKVTVQRVDYASNA